MGNTPERKSDFDPCLKLNGLSTDSPFYLAGEDIEQTKTGAVLIDTEEFRKRTAEARQPGGFLGTFFVDGVHYFATRIGRAIQISKTPDGIPYYGVPYPHRLRDVNRTTSQ